MQQLHPRAIWLFFIRGLSAMVPISFFIFGFSGASLSALFDNAGAGFGISFLLTPMIAILIAYLYAKLSFNYYRYELKPEGFRKEHGIIWKKYVTIPYDRIQNVDIYRGLIARLLGLSDLQIQTAGGITAGSYGAFSEGRLPGLDKAVAEKLRDEVIKRRPRYTQQGL